MLLLVEDGVAGSREARPLDLGWSEPLVFRQGTDKTCACVFVVVWVGAIRGRKAFDLEGSEGEARRRTAAMTRKEATSSCFWRQQANKLPAIATASYGKGTFTCVAWLARGCACVPMRRREGTPSCKQPNPRPFGEFSTGGALRQALPPLAHHTPHHTHRHPLQYNTLSTLFYIGARSPRGSIRIRNPRHRPASLPTNFFLSIIKPPTTYNHTPHHTGGASAHEQDEPRVMAGTWPQDA